MLRRLVFLLFGLFALGLGQPPVATAAMPVHHGLHGMPPGHCGDEGQCVTHVCIGCAIDPAEPYAPPPIAMAPSIAPQPRLPARFEDHRPGFDPPPPRALV
jgi:hypothetical protein